MEAYLEIVSTSGKLAWSLSFDDSSGFSAGSQDACQITFVSVVILESKVFVPGIYLDYHNRQLRDGHLPDHDAQFRRKLGEQHELSELWVGWWQAWGQAWSLAWLLTWWLLIRLEARSEEHREFDGLRGRGFDEMKQRVLPW